MSNPFEYKDAMNALHYTDEQKALLAAQAAQAAQSARRTGRHTRRPLLRTALIAACLTAALAVTAGATGVLKSAAEAFAPIFGGSAAQTEIIDKIGYPVGASDTAGGVTITADAVLGDRYNAAIVFTITRDDGTALLPAGAEDAMLLVRGGGVDLNILGGTHGGSWFVDEDPTDDTVQLIQTISSDVPINDCTATAKFEDLWLWDEESGESVPFAEGTWKLRFDVRYEDASVTLGGGETFTQDGLAFTIDAVTVSPVAFKVDYTVDSEVRWSDSGSGQQSEADSREMQRYFENVEILLNKTDGTVLDLSGAGGSISPDHGTTVCSKSNFFSEILPMEEIESIRVGGVEFPLA
ncbi:DUF4179 domain-containing protein [Dysosmobacter sp.]|uniref:DUF4179 domain-containing protein n=1 Tax=Dysosmobacter sp. TaxID=2591382 RepID=UPI002A9F9FDE|nr:DUF4179 domain-containing protein [Dysosmobacter sp.]MCI6055544.1 DUF4179 domain-containing protein [Dysosmobacter sp.]MDY5510635.1 DUF4179 domain-containing protein [Dysosmobacter sp.]